MEKIRKLEIDLDNDLLKTNGKGIKEIPIIVTHTRQEKYMF